MTPAAATLAGFLIDWQRIHGRHDLPWQNTRDPYRVWLSEIMLQQTQVSTVLSYYERFLQRFPDVQALAAAPQDDVLALWSGLGYYSRARNLHRCAQVLAAEHGGEFPRSSAALAELPGIGRSTAAAIAAFCFGERIAILDGNVKRVLTRALGFGHDLAEAKHERTLWQHAQGLLPERDIEAYTQGLMDLGATLCTARRPACIVCPWTEVCAARVQGRPEAYPVKTRKLKRGQRASSLLLLTQAQQVWLVQRPQTGVWAGLWSLPDFVDDDALQALAGDGPGEPQAWPALTHVLTHFDWLLRPWHWALPARVSATARKRIEAALPEGRWFARPDALALGLPAPVRRLLAQLP
ncbi:A/G-specific adenine glycosylase [Aquabacterium sp.]|uniref:A/G-specific adenine glycosylase n=1 Tax=Aquabacterium sp. TaxID=1872578 RepID=UPI002BB6920D|nr:A/G-specific adenine glycosylase [Aquabacterium sp.]HSW06255.1 A/G-specific adenine glycosylase [Aquabacterium sp.]